MKTILMKTLNIYLPLIIIGISIVLCFNLISNSIAKQQNDNDYAELNQIKYGLFSIDVWKRHIALILGSEIKKFYLTKSDERELRKHIEVLMGTLIDKVADKVKEGNSNSTVGMIKQSLINIFVNLDDIKKGTPEYADAVIRELTKPSTKKQLKALLNKQLEQYLTNTFEPQNTSRLQRILVRTDTKDIESARVKLKQAILADHNVILIESLSLIFLMLLLFSLSGFTHKLLSPFRYLILVLSLLILLVTGVTMPMINLEAAISQLNLILIGYPIHFENQILYFQSKSILDVFWIMITNNDIMMKFVGILLITFSVFFPLLKLISSAGYYYNIQNAQKNPIIRFFVIKSGKWSMADVMTVAIFIAYIGFNGIVTSQFGQLNSNEQEFVLLTTNRTSLQPGYYIFLTYTVLALFFSGFLTRKPKTG